VVLKEDGIKALFTTGASGKKIQLATNSYVLSDDQGLTVIDGGNVGIGTVSPGAKLDVSGGGIKNQISATPTAANASTWTTIDTNTSYTGVLYNEKTGTFPKGTG